VDNQKWITESEVANSGERLSLRSRYRHPVSTASRAREGSPL